MTATIALGLALALAASLALNTGFLLQHEGNAVAPPVDVRRPLRTLGGLLRQRAWLLGLALGTGGWALHVAALTRAPLSLVQAFVAGGLALLAPIATRWFGHSLRRSERVAVAAMAAGLAALGLGIHAPVHHGDPHAGLAVFLGGCAAAAAVMTFRATGARLALAAGVLYGAADTAIKALTIAGSHGGIGTVLVTPWPALAAITTIGAFFAFQRALQTGAAVTAIALMTAATYAVSIVAGVALLGEPLGHGFTGVLHAAAFAAVVAAAWVLSPIQAGQRDGGTYSGIRRSPSVAGWRVRRTTGSLSAGIRDGCSNIWGRSRSRRAGRSP